MTPAAHRIVIDADVACAANPRQPDQRCILCADALEALLRVRHSIAMTSSLLAEWNAHASRFAAVWLQSMYARRRVVKLIDDDILDESLRTRVVSAVTTGLAEAEIRKDMHLIEAARATDERVISSDRKAQRAFVSAAITVNELASVMWTDPAEEGEQCADWLSQGAPPEQRRRLRP